MRTCDSPALFLWTHAHGRVMPSAPRRGGTSPPVDTYSNQSGAKSRRGADLEGPSRVEQRGTPGRHRGAISARRSCRPRAVEAQYIAPRTLPVNISGRHRAGTLRTQ